MENNPYEMSSDSRNLLKYNTFRVSAWAKKFVEFKFASDLIDFFNSSYSGESYMVLGGGSNVLFKENYDGIVFHSVNSNIEFLSEGRVKAFAGVNWDGFVSECTRNGLVGLGALSHIPGTVGAAPVQNIGAYGTEVSSFIEQVECYDVSLNKTVILSNDECDFSYRSSIFKKQSHLIVVSVVFKLFKTQAECYLFKSRKSLTILDKVRNILLLFYYCFKSIRFGRETSWKLKMNFEYIRAIVDLPVLPEKYKRKAIVFIRKRNMPDPKTIANAGCFFKSPVLPKNSKILEELDPSVAIYGYTKSLVKISAGDLIRSSGAVELNRNGVRIDKNRPLIIINDGSSDGMDIYCLASEVQGKVVEYSGVEIEPEVVII